MSDLRLTDIVKRFGATTVVDRISLHITNGEFVSLLGPSGCGKTTTLKIIAGFELPDAGHVAFDGQDVSKVPAERRDIGIVFQNYALFPHMTVAGNVAFGLEMRRVGKDEIAKRVARVLDMVQLTALADRYPRQLSGGQQQRVALARALVIEPRFLLLDEPLANLDAKLREEMRLFIRELQQRVGITTIYVTHDQSEAMTMSDRVVVMFAGRIAQAAAPTEIYERPATLDVARFVGQANLIGGVVAMRDGTTVARTPFGTTALRGNFREGQQVNLLLRPEAIALDGDVPAVVTARIYSGNSVEYRVQLGDGTMLQVQSPPTHGLATGDRVGLRVDPARLWAIADAA